MYSMNTGHETQVRRIAHTMFLYFRYTKPRVWILLVFTASIGAIIAFSASGSATSLLVLLAIAATILGSAGAEAITNYIDRSMDNIMLRTKNRPLPTGELDPARAVVFGSVLIAASVLLLAFFGKLYAAGFMALGVFDNVFVYSYLLKKRTPWSIVLGGFSGGFPVVIGWYTVTSQFSLVPWFLFALVTVWIPIHVWSLAYRYRDDYANARVPMLPVLYSDRISAWCISGSAMVLVIFSIIPYVFGFETLYYALIVFILAVPMIILSVRFIKHPNKQSSFRLFKYSSPYLAIVFTLFMVFTLI